MCTGAELAAAAPYISTAVGAGTNIYGSNAGADAQKNAANQQAQNAMWMYNQDTNKDIANSNYLSGLLPSLPNPTQYFGTDGINKQYDVARSNLNYNMNQNVSDASSQAGALAASRGFANPSGFVANSANQVRSSFVPQFGALEQGRAGAMQQNQKDMYNAETQKMLSEYLNRFNLVNSFGAPNQRPINPYGGGSPMTFGGNKATNDLFNNLYNQNK